ncbi:MAG: hypothetical protein GY795_20175 [Desulfobacterales bacterium]|nr:hypothetical protein [Desulfobacterales bacterium]
MMTEQTEKTDKTDWHRLWCLMMSPVFERLGCETTVELDLSSKPQRLDMVVISGPEAPHYDELDPSYYEGFENLNTHNLISFKSFREVFNATALEEFYGYFTSYRKDRNISEKDKGTVNLYAVTHHFPQKLFAPFQGTKFLRCIREKRIYELGGILTPVRFIITRGNTHPVMGLFSDDPGQITASRRILEEDRWLLREVSSYLRKLFDYYFKEGFDMAYTKEMFIKEHYPEWHEKIQAAKKEGISQGVSQGIAKGELIGKILVVQQITNHSLYCREELETKSDDELERIFDDIGKNLNLTLH